MVSKPETMTLSADLEGWKVNGGTVPPDLVVTGQDTDIVLIDKQSKKIILLELTCHFDSADQSFRSAFNRKTQHYKLIALYCKGLGFSTKNLPLEIGSQGVISARKKLEDIG